MFRKKKSVITVVCNCCDKQMIRTITYHKLNPFKAVHSYYMCEKCKKLIEIKIESGSEYKEAKS